MATHEICDWLKFLLWLLRLCLSSESRKGAWCMRMAFDHPHPTLASWADPSLGQLRRYFPTLLNMKCPCRWFSVPCVKIPSWPRLHISGVSCSDRSLSRVLPCSLGRRHRAVKRPARARTQSGRASLPKERCEHMHSWNRALSVEATPQSCNGMVSDRREELISAAYRGEKRGGLPQLHSGASIIVCSFPIAH
jgi:hypothetical protein